MRSRHTKLARNIYKFNDVYTRGTDLVDSSAIIEYLDTQEMEGTMLASYGQNKATFIENKITHQEIHPSVILSMMANQVIFPSTNPYPRNAFSCGQSKQAVSMFHTNYQNRLDKSAILHQQQQTELDRSIRFSLTNTIGSLEITENAAARANRVLGFDNLGEFEEPKVEIKLFNAIGSTPEFLISRIDKEPSLFDKLSPDESINNE